MTIYVKKRDGAKEDLNLDKIHKVVSHACEGITGVSPSEVEINSRLQFYSGIDTDSIQETLIKSAADLITEETPNYQYVAGRLINYQLRKAVYNSFTPPSFVSIIQKNVELGVYDEQILQEYTVEELNELGEYIDHDRDETLTYAAMEQLRSKYLVKNRITNQFYETPQICYMMIAATLFGRYPQETRMRYVKDYYDALTKYDISLPTPVMAGVRTPQRQFSSCVLIETGDSLDSITATNTAIVKYVSQKAGIGIGAGRIRALGSSIRNGDVTHTGVIPFYKMFQAAVNSCNQGGVRKGSATLYYPWFHLEVEELIVLKNNKGTEETRIRHLDYGMQFNRLFFERMLSNSTISLFSPADVPELYDAFFSDQEKFKELYETAERNTRLRKKTIKALDLINSYIQERKDTGRIYSMNVDNCNTHSPFDEHEHPVKMSNLCAEITQYTNPLNDIHDEEGRIALCTLSAINWGKIKKPSDFAKPCDLAVRALDELLDYQRYPVLAAQLHTEEFRPLGIGIINFAYWLAKNDTTYQDPNLELIDEYAEAWSYYLIKASVELAKEKGPCKVSNKTKYGKGVTPNQTYAKAVDELVPHKERMDWSTIRSELKEHGIRNASLMAAMPSETSSQLANATNGIEPPRSFVSVKRSKDGVLKQVVPGYPRLKNKYDLLWDQLSPEGYLKICAVLQKYIDQAISVNTSYNPEHYEDGKVPMSELLKHIIMHYRYGGKTLYYCNTLDGSGEVKITDAENLVSSLDTPEEDCDSCKI